MPAEYTYTHVQWSLLVGGGNTENHEASNVHSRAANASNNTTNDHTGHVRCTTAKGATCLEDCDSSNEEPFDVVNTVCFTPRENSDGTQTKSCTEPGQVLSLTKAGNNGRLYIGDLKIKCNVRKDPEESSFPFGVHLRLCCPKKTKRR